MATPATTFKKTDQRVLPDDWQRSNEDTWKATLSVRDAAFMLRQQSADTRHKVSSLVMIES